MNVCGEDQPATSQTAWRATPDIRALEAAISESALIVKERQAGIGVSAREAHRSTHSSRAVTVHAPLPNRQHKERVYLHLLNNVGRDESTF